MTTILAPGRWDDWLALVDLETALGSSGTDRAVRARPRATPDIDANGTGLADTPACGQPVSLAVLGREAFVVNHSGLATPAEALAFQHGHPGSLSVIDLDRAASSDGATDAIAAVIPLGLAGPVGIAAAPDGRHLLVASAEARGVEDGGRSIAVVDAQARRVVARAGLALRGEGVPEPLPAPAPGYGRYPCPNGIAVSSLGLVVTGNGGSEDVSIASLERVLAGRDDAELARLPISSGGFGVTVSPDGRLAAVAARESMREAREGNRIHLIDLQARREVASVLVGTDDPNQGTRPFMAAWTPDGRYLLAACFRSDTVSLIDVDHAVAGGDAVELSGALAAGGALGTGGARKTGAGEVARLALATPSGGPGAPRGVAITSDGRHAIVSGGRKTGRGSSVLFVLTLDPLAPDPLALVSTVTGIGNETYLIGIDPG